MKEKNFDNFIKDNQNLSEKISLERLVFDIDSKIIHTHEKITYNHQKFVEAHLDSLNREQKRKGEPERYLTLWDKPSVTQKSYDKIQQIIKQDRINRNFR